MTARDPRRRTVLAAAHVCTLSVFLMCFSAASVHGGDLVKPRETRESPSNGYVGRPVAHFSAVSTGGKVLSSETRRSEVLIIDLWGLNCASCLEEMKALESIYQEYKDQGLKVWAVNTEDIGGPEIEEGLRARELEPTYDILPDPGLRITKLFTTWFIPVTVIVDNAGIVQYYKIGYQEADADKIKAKVGALLAP